MTTMDQPDERPTDLLRGFAPLVVAAVLAVLIVLLVPSVAPERFVAVPAEPTTTTTRPTTTTTQPSVVP